LGARKPKNKIKTDIKFSARDAFLE